MVMEDLRRSIEDSYLTLIAVASVFLVFIAGFIWVTALFVKKVKSG